MPPEGQNVVVTLVNGREDLAYWSEGQWWIGVENDPNDVVLDGVVSWRWAE